MTREEWIKEGEKRFGENQWDWKFVCPSCGYIASLKDWKDAGASEGQVAFSCIGRNLGSKKEIFDKTGGPCNYAGGGLFGLNPVSVEAAGKTHSVFAFAPAEGE